MPQEDEELYDTGYGALGGLGTQSFEKVTSKIAQDGVHTGCNCDWCGTKNEIISSWPEIIMGSMGYPAPNWYVDQGLLYPRVGCANPGCRREIGVRYAPQELGRYVSSGLEAGVVYIPGSAGPATPAQVQGFKQQIAQAAGARR